MEILLTGSNGFFGKLILRKLTILSRITTLNRNKSDLSCDLVNTIPKLNNFDIIIHAAGKAHLVPINNGGNKTFFDINVKGTQNLLYGIELSSSFPKSFVFISTVAVYGVDSGQNINEKIPLLAKDPYGLSKIQAEELVLQWCMINNVICTILRLPLLVGNNPPGNLGAMIKGIQKGYFFNIGRGSAKKSMVLAEDVAKVILDVAKIGGIYNLTDGYHPTFAELSNNISFQLGKNKPMNIPNWFAVIVAKIGDLIGNKAPLNTNKLKKITSDLTFDDSKARNAFGWNPTPVLEGFRIIKE